MNASDLPKLPCWPRLRLCRVPLFHGTGLTPAEAIVSENRLRVADPGIPVVSLTRSLSEALGFAGAHFCGYRNDEQLRSGDGAAIFVLDREKLAISYHIEPFRDAVWDCGGTWSRKTTGEPMCRHECEEVIWRDIHPLRAVSVGIFRFERKQWTWERWEEPPDERQLHLFSRIAA